MDAQIYLLKNNKNTHVDRLIMDLSDVPEKQYQINDLVIENFKKLNLPQSEKNLLSFEARKQVRAYLDLEKNWLERMAAALIERVNKLRRKVVHLRADNIGSFVCLYALKYFKLADGKELILHLSDCPLKLFEKYVARITQKLGDRINCEIQKSSWLYPYETLYSTKSVSSLKKCA
jgi:hypothetical protein